MKRSRPVYSSANSKYATVPRLAPNMTESVSSDETANDGAIVARNSAPDHWKLPRVVHSNG